jgi:hypothetical protein
MSDRFCQTLHIGGPVRASDLPGLYEAMVECEEACDEADIPESSAIADFEGCETYNGDAIFRFQDPECGGETFKAITQFCRDNGIAYDLDCDGDYEYSPWRVRFRPGMTKVREDVLDGQSGSICIALEPLAAILARLEGLKPPPIPKGSFSITRDGHEEIRRGMLGLILADFRDLLGADIPDLPPFTVIRTPDDAGPDAPDPQS